MEKMFTKSTRNETQKSELNATTNGTERSDITMKDNDNNIRTKILENTNRERRIIVTLSVVTGCFAVCWSPFFVTLTVFLFCKFCETQNLDLLDKLNWLGAINSACNPIIYTIFTKEFRDAFKTLVSFALHKLICTKKSNS